MFKGKNNSKCGENAEKQEPLYTVGGNASEYNHNGKHSGVWKFLKMLKRELPYDPVIAFQRHISQDTIETLVYQCLSKNYLQ
jgi:hypothetical protein